MNTPTTIKAAPAEDYRISGADLSEISSVLADILHVTLTRIHAAQCRSIDNAMLSAAGKVELTLQLQAAAQTLERAMTKQLRMLDDVANSNADPRSFGG